jgi:hypothetical protein
MDLAKPAVQASHALKVCNAAFDFYVKQSQDTILPSVVAGMHTTMVYAYIMARACHSDRLTWAAAAAATPDPIRRLHHASLAKTADSTLALLRTLAARLCALRPSDSALAKIHGKFSLLG